jgi:hypothetical protein
MEDFKDFYLSLTDDQKVEFAKLAGTTPNYIRTHLVYGRKIPQRKTFDGLIRALAAFGSKVTRNDLLLCFFPPADDEEKRQKKQDRRRYPRRITN